MDIPSLRTATAHERYLAEASGLSLPSGSECLAWPALDGSALALVVVAPGPSERRVRAVAVGDPADPQVADAVVTALETVLEAINGHPS